MLSKWLPRTGLAALAFALWSGSASAQPPLPQPILPQPVVPVAPPGYNPGAFSYPNPGRIETGETSPLPRFFYYPYYYYPHSYWPQNSPQWPEPKGHPYVRPPAYMAYPPFKEPGWRYELWTPMKYYRGNHFWLDQF